MCVCVYSIRSTINIALFDYSVRQVSLPDCIGMGHTHLPFDIVGLAESEPSHQHVTLCTLLWESEGKEGRRGERNGGREGGRKERREKKGEKNKEERKEGKREGRK